MLVILILQLSGLWVLIGVLSVRGLYFIWSGGGCVSGGGVWLFLVLWVLGGGCLFYSGYGGWLLLIVVRLINWVPLFRGGGWVLTSLVCLTCGYICFVGLGGVAGKWVGVLAWVCSYRVIWGVSILVLGGVCMF